MWGLIPVEYMKDGVLYREVIHVLRAIPAPGFNLRLLLQKHFFDQRYSNKKNAAMIAEVCDLLEQVVNIEVDTNLKKTRMWGGALPNPWALTDPRSATSVERLLSPFILPKIFNNLPGGYSGMDKVSEGYDQSTLVISGFPDVRTPESAEAAIRFYEDREEKYLEAVKAQDIAFEQGLIKCSKDPEEEVELVPILSFNGVNYNCLEPDLCMVFYFKYWFALSKEGMYREVEKLTMPKLVVALMDLFQFSSLDCNLKECSRDNFIKAHVGENNEIVTETSIHEKYKVTDAQSLGDFPYDGNLRDRRMGFELNLDQIRNPDEVTPEMIQLYYEYLRLQLTTTWNGLELDAWMSDRVLRCAQCVRRLSPDLCDKTAAALQWATTGLTVEAARSMQSLAHDEVSFAWARMNAALCFLNKTGKANPINLSIIWAMLCSDVLTHLGMRNESWRWVMFPILVAPGMGHLRAQTEDGHSARSECMLLAKPNGAGVDEVVLKIFQWFLHLVGEVSAAAFPRPSTALTLLLFSASPTAARVHEGAADAEGGPHDAAEPRGDERGVQDGRQDLQPAPEHRLHEAAVRRRVPPAARRGGSARSCDDRPSPRFARRRGRDLQEPGVQEPRPPREGVQPAASRHGHVLSSPVDQHQLDEPKDRRGAAYSHQGRALSVSSRRAAGEWDGAADRG